MSKTEMRSLKSAPADQGEIVIVRASKLAEAGTTGKVAWGKYEKSEPNKFNPQKNDYFVRGSDNTLFIINGTSSLSDQMEQLKGLEGTEVEIIYNGKKETKSGRGYHDFDVRARVS